MTDRLAELGALQYAVENLSTAGTNPNRLGLAGYIHAAYTDYQAWAAANPSVNPNRLSAKGRLYGYFYDHASWSPSSLFAASEVGAWYDPSDLTTMFQDRTGSTPVTADGQTVGKILDKSGRGNHATAPSDAARPLYKTDGTYHWLQFDGVDDSLSTAAIDFTGTDKMSAFSGVRVFSLSSIIADIGASAAGSFYLYFNLVSQFEIGRRGNGAEKTTFSSVYATPTAKKTTTMCIDLANAIEVQAQKVNGANDGSVGTADSGGGNFASSVLQLGSRGSSLRLNGNIYSLIVRGALSTTQEITDTETWVNQRTGAY